MVNEKLHPADMGTCSALSQVIFSSLGHVRSAPWPPPCIESCTVGLLQLHSCLIRLDMCLHPTPKERSVGHGSSGWMFAIIADTAAIDNGSRAMEHLSEGR